MKNKTRILHIRLSKEESDDLDRKVMISGLSKSSLIRLLIKGYEPREKPDAKFYEVTKELYAIGNNLNQLAYKANKLNLIDKEEYKRQVATLNNFIVRIEKEFLSPVKSELRYKWWFWKFLLSKVSQSIN